MFEELGSSTCSSSGVFMGTRLPKTCRSVPPGRLTTKIRNADYFLLPWHSLVCCPKCCRRGFLDSFAFITHPLLPTSRKKSELSATACIVGSGRCEGSNLDWSGKKGGISIQKQGLYTPLMTNSGMGPGSMLCTAIIEYY